MQTVKRLQEQGSMQNIVMSEVQNQGAIADLAQLTTQNQSQNQTPQSPQPMAGGY
jgi:hypothetical protein